MQAIKLKELIYAGTDKNRERIVVKDYLMLQSLASAANPNRHLNNNDLSLETKNKLD